MSFTRDIRLFLKTYGNVPKSLFIIEMQINVETITTYPSECLIKLKIPRVVNIE